MSPPLTVHPVLFALFVAPLALPAPVQADEPSAPPTEQESDSDDSDDSSDPHDSDLIEDLARPFAYLGGGAGVRLDTFRGHVEPLGKIGVGAGLYVPMLTLGGGADLTLMTAGRGMVEGFGNVGVAIPIPVWHPLIGFKVGAGLHWEPHGVGPHILYGPQVGWILRPWTRQLGLRALVEALVQYYPGSQTTSQQVTFTLSLVL